MSPPRIRRPARPHWHVVDRPVPATWHSDRVLQLMFNPNTETTTREHMAVATQTMADLTNGAPGHQEAETTIIHEEGKPWEGVPDHSLALVVTEVARTAQRPRYRESLKWLLGELVTQQRLASLQRSIGFDYRNLEADDDTRQAMSLVRLDPAEPDMVVRGNARTAMAALGEASAGALVRATLNPALWTPGYAHTNPDSDGWQEILRWCTVTFPTRAHARPWIAAGFTPMTAMDYRINGFTPQGGRPWLPVFPMEARAASRWAAAKVTPERAGPYLQAGYTPEEAGLLDQDPATKPTLEVLLVAGSLNR